MKVSLRLLAVFGTALLATAARAGDIDPSTLISKADAAAVLGLPSVAATSAKPEKDEDTGGMVTYCTYRGGQVAMIVSITTFTSAKEAKAKTTKELTGERVEGDDAKITEESGLGERAFWATTDRGAMYVVLKGSRVFSIAVGGKPPKPPASYRDALRTLTKSALEKL